MSFVDTDNYIYDDANRLTTLTDEASQNFTFGYDIADRLISKTLPNGVASNFEYDGMSRLTRLKHQAPTATLTDNNFAYDPANRISQIVETAQTKTFGYDQVDRLTSANYSNPTQANETFSFDAVGNRSSSHLSNSYGYQANNKLTSTQTATYSYDANGNMRSKSDASGYWIYGWDNENRMTSARKQNKIVRYQYDALGRRVSRKGKTLGSTKYTYDGLDVVMDDDLNNGIVKYQNGLGIDDKLKMVVNGQAKYFLQDHLGSTIGLTDSSGNVVSSASYDSFGNSTNNLTTRYQFTGREKDEFTGLMYYRARWYDSKLGRFISEDPIGFAGGDINLFGYVWNNPQHFTDPLGLEGGWGSNSADWLDKRIAVARDFYQADVGYWGWNGTVNTIGDLASGVSDLLRVGNGTGHALYCEDNIYGQAAYITMDVARVAGIASIILGATAGRVGNTPGSSISEAGLSNRGFRPPAGTRVKPQDIPENWRIKPTKGSGGTRYVDPKNPGNSVRVMPGNPKSPYANSQNPYVRWQRNGQALDRGGRGVSKNSPDAHIPLKDFTFDPNLF